MPSRERAWSWRTSEPAANRRLGLLYEPGNWGDILKGTWALIAARAIARSRAGGAFRYLDPFAGRAVYPLVETVAKRLEWLGGGTYAQGQRPWIERRELASTGLLVREAALAAGARPELQVFDLHAELLESWRGVEGARLLDVESGEAALAAARDDDGDDDGADLILVDPYDLFERWHALLPPAIELARRSCVLLYLYNKSPRGGGHARAYAALRRRLDEVGAGTALLGRIPSDVVLPRAFHEVLLLAPPPLVELLRHELRKETKALTCKMATSGAFEDLGRPPREPGDGEGEER
jgi:hypothetical protein